MWASLEHSSGCIYTTGVGQRFVDNPGGSSSDESLYIDKRTPNGDLVWHRYYGEDEKDQDKSSQSVFQKILEVREDVIAVLGYVRYKPRDDPDRSREGLWVALFDTASEYLAETHIHGDHLRLENKFIDFLQVEPNRVLALVDNLYSTILSIRFDLDLPTRR
jgi:hypothetical protein